MIEQAKQVAQLLREGDYPLMSQVISTIDALVTYAAESERRLLDTIQEKHLLETEVDRLRLKLDASTSRRETLRYQRDAAQAEVERITGEWAALSQDQGKAEREIERLQKFYTAAVDDAIKANAEVERLTNVDVEPCAYMYPDDYERMTTTETFCTVYSVPCGSPTQGSTTVELVPASALAALQQEHRERLLRIEKETEATMADYDTLRTQLAEAQSSPMAEEVIDILRSERDAAQAENNQLRMDCKHMKVMADEREALKAHNQRLREALTRIGNWGGTTKFTGSGSYTDVARAAPKGDV